MQYIATFERKWLQKGIEQGRQQGLEQGLERGLERGLGQGRRLGLLEKSRQAILSILTVRFESLPRSLVITIDEQDDLLVLETLLKKSAIVSSTDEFLALPDMNAPSS